MENQEQPSTSAPRKAKLGEVRWVNPDWASFNRCASRRPTPHREHSSVFSPAAALRETAFPGFASADGIHPQYSRPPAPPAAPNPPSRSARKPPASFRPRTRPASECSRHQTRVGYTPGRKSQPAHFRSPNLSSELVSWQSPCHSSLLKPEAGRANRAQRQLAACSWLRLSI